MVQKRIFTGTKFTISIIGMDGLGIILSAFILILLSGMAEGSCQIPITNTGCPDVSKCAEACRPCAKIGKVQVGYTPICNGNQCICYFHVNGLPACTTLQMACHARLSTINKQTEGSKPSSSLPNHTTSATAPVGMASNEVRTPSAPAAMTTNEALTQSATIPVGVTTNEAPTEATNEAPTEAPEPFASSPVHG